jgi:FixJ family two-component response regulator
MVMMSGAGPPAESQRLLDLEAIGLLEKPFKPAELFDWIERAVVIDMWQRRERACQRRQTCRYFSSKRRTISARCPAARSPKVQAKDTA